MTIPLLDAIAIQGKTITADALLTQHKIAEYVVKRQAHYHFTGKNILRAVMFAAFMARLFCSIARHENRRIAKLCNCFRNAAVGQKSAPENRKCGCAKYIHAKDAQRERSAQSGSALRKMSLLATFNL